MNFWPKQYHVIFTTFTSTDYLKIIGGRKSGKRSWRKKFIVARWHYWPAVTIRTLPLALWTIWLTSIPVTYCHLPLRPAYDVHSSGISEPFSCSAVGFCGTPQPFLAALGGDAGSDDSQYCGVDASPSSVTRGIPG